MTEIEDHFDLLQSRAEVNLTEIWLQVDIPEYEFERGVRASVEAGKSDRVQRNIFKEHGNEQHV